MRTKISLYRTEANSTLQLNSRVALSRFPRLRQATKANTSVLQPIHRLDRLLILSLALSKSPNVSHLLLTDLQNFSRFQLIFPPFPILCEITPLFWSDLKKTNRVFLRNYQVCSYPFDFTLLSKFQPSHNLSSVVFQVFKSLLNLLSRPCQKARLSRSVATFPAIPRSRSPGAERMVLNSILRQAMVEELRSKLPEPCLPTLATTSVLLIHQARDKSILLLPLSLSILKRNQNQRPRVRANARSVQYWNIKYWTVYVFPMLSRSSYFAIRNLFCDTSLSKRLSLKWFWVFVVENKSNEFSGMFTS